MYIEHLRKEFYELLLEESRVLIIAAPDVDAVCTVKILQYLFQIDNISYTLVSADGISDLREQFLRFHEKCKYVILVNCGGGVDVLSLFDNPQNIIIFIIDSHRPTHILNVFNESNQVRLVIPPGEGEDIPAFDDIFRADDSDSEGHQSDDDDDEEIYSGSEGDGNADENLTNGTSRKRSRRDRDMASIEKRRKKAEWMQHRERILFDYTQFSYYGAPASLIMLEVAWTMSRSEMELVWYAIVGLTDFYLMGKMERPNYILLTHQLQAHVSRLNNSQKLATDSVKVSHETEICLYLYRHWTVIDSLKMTPYFACKFRSWREDKRLHEFLAEVGLPLFQVRQKFSGMDLCFRKNLKDILIKKAEKYNLGDITIPSFTRQICLKKKFGAFDCHLAALAILESPDNELTTSQKFMASLECLSPDKHAELEKGVECAKNLVQAAFRQVQTFLETGSVTSVGPFLQASVSEGTHTKYFANPNSLSLLAQFTLRAHVENSRSRKMQQLPLILLTPQTPDLYLLAGIPPVAADASSNLFGKAFEKVAERLDEGVALDCFEPSIIQLRTEDKKKFLDKLLEILG